MNDDDVFILDPVAIRAAFTATLCRVVECPREDEAKALIDQAQTELLQGAFADGLSLQGLSLPRAAVEGMIAVAAALQGALH